MSEELLKELIGEIKSFRTEVNGRLDRIEKKLDATFEQSGKNAEIINQVNAHEHGLNVLNRKLFALETEVEKLKN